MSVTAALALEAIRRLRIGQLRNELADADDQAVVKISVNGVKVGEGNDWKRNHRFDVTKLLVHGDNVIAVKATGARAAAGLIVRRATEARRRQRRTQLRDAVPDRRRGDLAPRRPHAQRHRRTDEHLAPMAMSGSPV